MSLAPYRDTKLSSRSQAHLGFYDTHIYEISTLAYFALSVELPARSPNWQVLLHFGGTLIFARRDAVKASTSASR